MKRKLVNEILYIDYHWSDSAFPCVLTHHLEKLEPWRFRDDVQSFSSPLNGTNVTLSMLQVSAIIFIGVFLDDQCTDCQLLSLSDRNEVPHILVHLLRRLDKIFKLEYYLIIVCGWWKDYLMELPFPKLDMEVLIFSWSLPLCDLLVYRNRCNLTTQVHIKLYFSPSLWPVQAKVNDTGQTWRKVWFRSMSNWHLRWNFFILTVLFLPKHFLPLSCWNALHSTFLIFIYALKKTSNKKSVTRPYTLEVMGW